MRGLRVVLSILLLIIVVNIIFLFNCEYIKNVFSMIIIVIESLINFFKEWFYFVVNFIVIGWEKLCEYI